MQLWKPCPVFSVRNKPKLPMATQMQAHSFICLRCRAALKLVPFPLLPLRLIWPEPEMSPQVMINGTVGE